MKTNAVSLQYIGRSFQAGKTLMILGSFLSFSILTPFSAQAKTHKAEIKENTTFTVSDEEILKSSEISYKADGGFTGIKSYGVIISCVNGKISVLKSVHDPARQVSVIRQKGTLDRMSYVALWKNLIKQDAFQAKDIAEPKMDIRDEFTVRFEARIGKVENNFKVHGIKRNEACQHFAIKSLIDSAVQMQAFVGSREKLAFISR